MQQSLRPRPYTPTAVFQQRTPFCVPTKLSAVSGFCFVYKGDNIEQEELDIVAEECEPVNTPAYIYIYIYIYI